MVAAVCGGCATVGRQDAPPGDAISGRLSLRVDAAPGAPARTVSASFDLQGSPSIGQLNLSTPLGTVLAQARWSRQEARLITPDGESTYPDLDSLTQQMLGESIPVAALFDWLRGRPWTGAPSRASAPPEQAGFQQLGWTVGLARFDEGWVVAQRPQPPAVTVRARVDRP